MFSRTSMTVAVILLVFIMLFSGCSGIEMDADALMTAPALTEEQAKLNAAISDVAGDTYYPRYPSNGSYSSSFMFYDIDDDGQNEALAFYSTDNENIKANILKNRDGSWVSVCEVTGQGSDADSVYFADMGDGLSTIVIKWENDIGIYHFINERLETVFSSSCDGVQLEDMNDDGSTDIVVFSGTLYGKSSVRILYCETGDLVISDSTGLNANYDQIYSTVCGKNGDGKTGLFIDSEIYDGIYLTEFITLEDGGAERYTIADFAHEEKEVIGDMAAVTLVSSYGKRGIYARNTGAACEDVDRDGIIEMPVEVREDSASEGEERLFFIDYMQYDGKGLKSVWHGFANADRGYRIQLPDSWDDSVTVFAGDSAGECVFATYEGETIMSVKAVRSGEYQDRYDDSYTVLYETPYVKYCAKVSVPKGNAYYISPEMLSSLFETI